MNLVRSSANNGKSPLYQYSKVPVNQQVTNLVMFAIISGQLKEGDKLPTLEEAAIASGAHRLTIDAGYRELRVRGYVRSLQGHRACVSKDARVKCLLECRTRIIKSLFIVMAEAKASGMDHTETLRAIEQRYKVADGPYDDL